MKSTLDNLPKVSIYIPTYNQSKYLAKAIASALVQSYNNIEVIIGDDNSTDDTAQIVEEFIEDKRVKYYRNHANIGRVGNYRKGLYELATGDYFLNLDGDDWLTSKEFVSETIILFKRNPELVLVLGNFVHYYEDTDTYVCNRNNKTLSRVSEGNSFVLNYPFSDLLIGHLAVVYDRKKAVERSFYSQNILSSDLESLFKLMINNKIGYLPINAGVWRHHSSNATKTASDLSLMENLAFIESVYQYTKEKGGVLETQMKIWRYKMIHYFYYGYFISLFVNFNFKQIRIFLKTLSRVSPLLPISFFFDLRTPIKLLINKYQKTQ